MEQMKLCSKCSRILPVDRFSKSKNQKSGLKPSCKDCASAYHAANRERDNARCRAYALLNKDSKREYDRARYAENSEAIKARVSEYRKTPAGRASDIRGHKKFNKTPLGRLSKNKREARRRFAREKATPKWADHEMISEIYARSDALSRASGVPHEVDHIFPLRGKLVTGLHVETNLRVIPAIENRRKGNRMPPTVQE